MAGIEALMLDQADERRVCAVGGQSRAIEVDSAVVPYAAKR